MFPLRPHNGEIHSAVAFILPALDIEALCLRTHLPTATDDRAALSKCDPALAHRPATDCLVGLCRVLELLEYSSFSIPKFESGNYFTVQNCTENLNSYGKVLLNILLLLLIIIIKCIITKTQWEIRYYNFDCITVIFSKRRQSHSLNLCGGLSFFCGSLEIGET